MKPLWECLDSEPIYKCCRISLEIISFTFPHCVWFYPGTLGYPASDYWPFRQFQSGAFSCDVAYELLIHTRKCFHLVLHCSAMVCLNEAWWPAAMQFHRILFSTILCGKTKFSRMALCIAVRVSHLCCFCSISLLSWFKHNNFLSKRNKHKLCASLYTVLPINNKFRLLFFCKEFTILRNWYRNIDHFLTTIKFSFLGPDEAELCSCS